MGRIKTIFIKRIGRELFESNEEKFSEDFAQNKEVVKGMADFSSKKTLNIVTGYVTSLKKQKRL